jgi:RND family efflux transporter MFP subunit
LIVLGVGTLLLVVVALYLRSVARTDHVALSDAPRPVSVERAQAASFRPLRSYVGTTAPWNSAKVGPQYVSAYVGAVLVRPGALVQRGQVLATLDCRNASAASKEIAARAKALEERQAAVEHETQRTKELSAGGFASENEVEQLSARSASEKAEVESLRASLISRSLEVDDCILRAPFVGEVTERYVDPGAYLRPGNPVAAVIDRSTLRISADAPESDFNVVRPGTPVEIEVEAVGMRLQTTVSRRAPAADDVTRTVHFEIDIPNVDRKLPANATARVHIHVGEPHPATVVPLRAAVVRGDKATLFTVESGRAKRVTVPVLGEEDGRLYVDPKLSAQTLVVVEGRALLEDGAAVAPKELAP